MIPLVPAASLRQQASSALKGHWGTAIIATIIYTIITQFCITYETSQRVKQISQHVTVSTPATSGAATIGVVISIIGILLWIIKGPLEYGLNGLFLKIRDGQQASVSNLFDGFKLFSTNVGLGIRKDIFTVLWTCLLVVPGIIKYFAYSMSFYIKNDRPELTAKEVMDLSSKLMYGYKWKFFCLQLSFIGWHLLSACTLGILEYVYVIPKNTASDAEFYNYYIRPRINEAV